MKTWIMFAGICLALLVACGESPQASTTPSLDGTTANETKRQTIIPDLAAIPEGNVWKGNIDVARVVEEDGATAIEIDDKNFNVIWLDGFEFTAGTIEFDVKGKSEPPQSSFVGIAFWVEDDLNYDAIYFRPFNFDAVNAEQRAHAVQYVSSPNWTWDQLRAQKPGQYEQSVEPAPDGDMWFHSKIVVEGRDIKVFVNNANEPALQVTALSDRTGSVGLYCYGYGVISDLEITPEE